MKCDVMLFFSFTVSGMRARMLKAVPTTQFTYPEACIKVQPFQIKLLIGKAAF